MNTGAAREGAWAPVEVESAAGPYKVWVERGGIRGLPERLVRDAPAHRFAIISDDRVAPLYGGGVVEGCRAAGLRADLFGFPHGEPSKTRRQWSMLTDALLDAGFGRDTTVVALGGGVTTDLAGFVAATFHRGVPLVQVPTSYLAMIDASVGGKTGVDSRHGKNLVGAFHPPRFVLADPEVLETLPMEERAAGLVEAFKHGAVLDAVHFRDLAAEAKRLVREPSASAGPFLRRSIELKAEVVSADEREAGYREVLNFGHTVGHAVEAASGFVVGHGRAVAIGMIIEATLGERLGVTASGTSDALSAALSGLDLAPLPALDLDRVTGFLGADKKARAGRPRFVLLERVGAVAGGSSWSREAPPELVEEVVRERLPSV